MDESKLRAHIKKEIDGFDKEMLDLASMFIYNWIEGPWTPDPLTPEQMKELEKRLKEAKGGKTYTSEEVFKMFEEKYGYVRDESEEYKAARLADLRKEVLELLEYVGGEDLIRLDIFLKSYSSKYKWGSLDKEAQESIQRGIEDAEAGRLTDISLILEKYS